MGQRSVESAMANSLFAIGRRKAEAFDMAFNHFHNYYEIYYLLSGERYYFIKDRTYHVRKGNLVFINMYDLHKTTTITSTYERILIDFKKTFLTGFIEHIKDIDMFACFDRQINIARLNIKQQHSVEGLLFKMIDEFKNRTKGFDTALKVSLMELLLFLNRYTAAEESEPLEHPSSLHEKVSEIARYINEHYGQHISLRSTAERFFISPYYLSRVYKKITGFTFVEYLNSVRIKEAQRLLRESALNITQIAEKTGYESITHFGRVFKDITGCSPLQYRKML